MIKNILWNFEKERFSSIKEFEKALINYNETIKEEVFKVSLDTKIVKCAEVVIQYSHWSEEEDDIVEPSFLLKANNDSFFTPLELLYKVHNTVCEKLKDEDHKFFEGFDLWEGENPNHPDVPLYFLELGS